MDTCPCCPPSRKLQEKMLHQLTALSGAPTREEILERVKHGQA